MNEKEGEERDGEKGGRVSEKKGNWGRGRGRAEEGY